MEFLIKIKNYLKKFAFSNAEQDDLWNELDKQAKIDNTLDPSLSVKSIMDTWTRKKGYPVVLVERSKSNRNNIKLTQKWFLLNSNNSLKANATTFNQYRWYIPFTYTTKLINDFKFESNTSWLKPEDIEGNF